MKKYLLIGALLLGSIGISSSVMADAKNKQPVSSSSSSNKLARADFGISVGTGGYYGRNGYCRSRCWNRRGWRYGRCMRRCRGGWYGPGYYRRCYYDNFGYYRCYRNSPRVGFGVVF